MDASDEFDAMAEVCIAAHEAVMKTGTPEMQAVSRVLLFQIGQELARLHAEEHQDLNRWRQELT